jgi:protein-S-isoprenylcysteine O-methyltransferase Ste14
MTDAASSVVKRLIAILVLAVAAWFLLKVVLGAIAGLVTAVLIVVALFGLLWAWRTL